MSTRAQRDRGAERYKVWHGKTCDCGRPAVGYNNGYVCARCHDIELRMAFSQGGANSQYDTTWQERQKRRRLLTGLPIYSVCLPGWGKEWTC